MAKINNDPLASQRIPVAGAKPAVVDDDFDAPVDTSAEPIQAPVVPASKPVAVPKWKVVKDTTIRIGAQSVRLKAGDILSAAMYSSDFFLQLEINKIPLEKIEG
jgi:hypothetical protein